MVYKIATGSARYIGILSLLFVLSMDIYLFYLLRVNGQNYPMYVLVFYYIIAIIAVPISLFGIAYGPSRYIIDGDYLSITRCIGSPVMIPMTEIVKADYVEKPKLTRTKNFGSNNGIFSYYGSYHEMYNGLPIKVYCKRLRKTVCVVCKNQAYFLSPENPMEFINNLSQCLTKY